jgi:hypothetical protein
MRLLTIPLLAILTLSTASNAQSYRIKQGEWRCQDPAALIRLRQPDLVDDSPRAMQIVVSGQCSPSGGFFAPVAGWNAIKDDGPLVYLCARLEAYGVECGDVFRDSLIDMAGNPAQTIVVRQLP